MGNIQVKFQQGTPQLTSTYDAANRLVTSIQGSTTMSYTDDNNGNLTRENRGGVETEYVPDTQGSLIGCRDSAGNVT